MQSLATKEFTAKLHLEGSWGGRKLGEHVCKFEVFKHSDNHLEIECIYGPEGEIGVEHIGITVDNNKTVTDYDGVFSVPNEAVEMLESLGYTCPDDVIG